MLGWVGLGGDIQSDRNIWDIPRLVPVPANLRRKLEGFLSVNVEPHVGVRIIDPIDPLGRVGKDNSGLHIPHGRPPFHIMAELVLADYPVPTGICSGGLIVWHIWIHC